MGHPLTVAFETEEINIGDAKYPQVGIGPNDGIYSSNYWDGRENQTVLGNDGSKWSKNDLEGAMKVIYHTCHPGTTYAHENNATIAENEGRMFDEDTELQETHLDDIRNNEMSNRVIPFLKKGMINCSEIIKGCLLNGKSYDCTTLFKEHFSEWGSTCIFNGIPAKATRRYDTIQSELGGSTKEEIEEWEKADLDEYVINARKQKPRKKRPAVPWRQLAPGKSSGLTFAIKEELEDKACLAVNNPRDEPQIERFGTSLPYGREIYVSLYPEILLAEEDAKDIGMERRGCYFSDDGGDAYLEFYKKYSRQNCLEECFAKKVYEKCECAKVSSPGFPGRKLCSLPDVNSCIRVEEEQMYNEGLKTACPKCRPNCRDTKYRTSVTWSRMTDTQMNRYRKMYYGPSYTGNKNITISVVNVYFVVDSVHPIRRSARYSTFEEVGLVGGTVSMITGLTLLDEIECFVVITVIIFAKYKMGNLFHWNPSIPEFLRRRNNRVAPEEIELPTIQPQERRPVQRSALSRPPPFHPMENLPGFTP
ncbi:Pickpocket protein 28 [Folsomia candida]|uniref:Pickpocket protein 28 n=1 Tax=Folsomia candida TaxID=158441 RepID=A0A226DP89_FOLCA|nr:Pickpocket protein 28 [Folsomia candida]